jgi:predicted metal-dependent phosphoesterase TrpH
MKFAVDLHIHSALSSCADDDMTPNNIVRMAELKGLDFISVTDHNSAANIEAVIKCAEGSELIVVPGLEIETVEEVHLLCFFPSIRAALNVSNIVYQRIPDYLNREDIFGAQLVMDKNDTITGKLDKLLMTASLLSIEDVFELTEKNGGAVIPAHIDRSSYSMLYTLGSIPENLNIKYVEVTRNYNGALPNNYQLNEHIPIMFSDAHSLGQILERETYLELPGKNLKSLINALKTKNVH